MYDKSNSSCKVRNTHNQSFIARIETYKYTKEIYTYFQTESLITMVETHIKQFFSMQGKEH